MGLPRVRVPEGAYLNLTKLVSELPQTVHSNVRISWSTEAVGSIRASVVGVPHLPHGGRWGCI